jgi:hypothetical protein
MGKDHPVKSPTHSWQAGWKDNERAQLRSWLKATPAQRLAWLEEAIKLAYEAGALQPKQPDM